MSKKTSELSQKIQKGHSIEMIVSKGLDDNSYMVELTNGDQLWVSGAELIAELMAEVTFLREKMEDDFFTALESDKFAN